MSYYADLGAAKVTVSHKTSTPAKAKVAASRDHRVSSTTAAEAASAAAGGAPSVMPKLLLFGGIGVAALIAVKLFKKKGGRSSSPSIALFGAPKVST